MNFFAQNHTYYHFANYCRFLLIHPVYNNWYVLCFSVDCLLAGPVKRQSVELGMAFDHHDRQALRHLTSFCGDFLKKEYTATTQEAWKTSNITMKGLLLAMINKIFFKLQGKNSAKRLITVRLTFLTQSICMKPNFQALLWVEFSGFVNGEL